MDFFAPFFEKFAHDLSLGRMTESIVVFFIVWNRLKPKLEKMDDRLDSIEKAVTNGFKSGESRFEQIEHRLEKLEVPITALTLGGDKL